CNERPQSWPARRQFSDPLTPRRAVCSASYLAEAFFGRCRRFGFVRHSRHSSDFCSSFDSCTWTTPTTAFAPDCRWICSTVTCCSANLPRRRPRVAAGSGKTFASRAAWFVSALPPSGRLARRRDSVIKLCTPIICVQSMLCVFLGCKPRIVSHSSTLLPTPGGYVRQSRAAARIYHEGALESRPD